MRGELKKFDWHIHGLNESDIDYAYNLVKKIIKDRKKVLDDYSNKVRTENPTMAPDILDDIYYYHGLETLILWQFGLWRLQGIFEGTMILKYLEDPALLKLVGLKAKLKKMREAGYTIDQQDYDDLIEWGYLRNALSHCPPERYCYVALSEDDIKEYIGLIKKVISLWDKEKPNITL